MVSAATPLFDSVAGWGHPRPTRGVPLTPAASIDSLDAGFHFNMLGAVVHLQHPYDPAFALTVRTSLDGQHWSAWQALTFAASDGQGGHGALANTYSDPLWVGQARYLQYASTPASSRWPRLACTSL